MNKFKKGLPIHYCILSFLFTIIGLTSCSSDDSSNEGVQNIITVSTSNLSITIDENPLENQTLGTVTGTTNQGNVVFSISEQSPSNAFKIDANTGKINVNDASVFNFEINPIITGIVKVLNGDVSEDALVTITLNDIQESSIFDGDVYLLTQEEVNSFGAHNYTEITGDLVIGNYDFNSITIIDLGPLLSLESVKRLYILKAEELVSLQGLNNLSSSIVLIQLISNTSLTSIEALSGVTSFSGLYSQGNHSLQNLNGLHNISGTVSTLDIRSNNALVNVDALNNITLLTGSLLLGGNASLINIDGLSNITSIGSQLKITDNISLQNIDGLNSLTEIIGSSSGLSIIGNDLIQNLDGLSNLTYIGSGIGIQYNSSLTSIEGLSNITSVTKSIGITSNNVLTNLNGLHNISSIGEIFYLQNNDILNDLSALNNLNYVYEFRISNNDLLTNLDGLDNLSSIELLWVLSNPVLTNFCSLENLFTDGNSPNLFEAAENAYNPTYSDMINGNCSI